MEMRGERLIQAEAELVWAALNDPAVLKACLPGCDKLEPDGADQYAVGMAVKVGPVAARFTGRIKLSDIEPPSSYKLAFEGQGGAAGFAKGSSIVMLTSADASCQLAYTVQAQVGGKIAQLGQRLIDSAAKSIADSFFKRFDAEMQRRVPEHESDAAADAKGAVPVEKQRSHGTRWWRLR